MNLPNDIIEYILTLRDVFVVMRYTQENTTTCMGVYGNLHDAKKMIIQHVLDKDFEYYIPSQRFIRQELSRDQQIIMWSDRWESSGIDCYCIETWKQNRSDGMIDQLFCSFDFFLKSLIIEKQLTYNQIQELIISWKSLSNLIEYDALFSNYSTYINQKVPTSTPEIRMAWQVIYG